MSLPDLTRLIEVCDVTWPAAGVEQVQGWHIRNGAGGGKRVSTASVLDAGALPDIEVASKAMQGLGQPSLFRVAPGDEALDRALEECGYEIVDPVNIYCCDLTALSSEELKRLAAFVIYPPLAAMKEVWAQGGIGSERLVIMERAECTHTAILGRANDRVAGAAFIGIDGDIAMLHALEVEPAQRRQGVAVNMMRMAARWASQNDAKWLAAVTTQANEAACALYASLNMTLVGQYHYRIKPQE